MTVLATAGHVDHGKSTLVQALTGTDPDRWDEEKARGLTIDLGFAALELDDRIVSMIDVPGHVRFLRNMLAGVGAVDAVLFVVAATEGWKPQSEEHLRILNLLGIKRGVVALTKIDQVDEDLRTLAELEIADHIENTFLSDAPIIGVSAIDGTGMDELRAALAELTSTTRRADIDRTRLWIDRVFSPAGAGTVVTGTLIGGPISVGDELVASPGDHRVRIRGIQSHHFEHQRLEPGARCAVALSGVSHHDLGRGHVLVEADRWHQTDRFDAEVTVLESLDHEVSRRGAYACYIGSAELPSRIRVLGTDAVLPGETAPIRVFLDRSLPLVPGDRFVLRELGRDETVGGGTILDVDPVVRASRAAPDRSVDRVVTERGWVTADELERLTGQRVAPTVGHWVVADDELAATTERVASRVAEAGAIGLELAQLSATERAVVDRIDGISVVETRVVDDSFVDPFADHEWPIQLLAEGLRTSSPEAVDRAEVRELVRRGYVIEFDGIYFAPRAVADAGQALADHLAANPDGFTVSEARDILDTSRKYVLALVGYFDANGMTRRRDDLRIAGPRLHSGIEQLRR